MARRIGKLTTIAVALFFATASCASDTPAEEAAVALDDTASSGDETTQDEAAAGETTGSTSSDAGDDDAAEGSTDDDQSAQPSSDSDESQAAGGVTVGVDGQAKAGGKTGPSAEVPALGEAPDWLEEVIPDIVVTELTETIDDANVYQYDIQFTSDTPGSEICEDLTARVQEAGYRVQLDACADDGNAVLINDAGQRVRFLELSDGGQVILSEDSESPIEEAIAEVTPDGLTLRPGDPVRVVRRINADELSVTFRYTNDGNFVSYCEDMLVEIAARGYEQTTRAGCEPGNLVEAESDSPFTVAISNASEDTISYIVTADLAAWAATGGEE